jgi:hypothetical protein
METTKIEKQFDAVKMMREIKDKISSETQNMTFEELKAYIKQKLADNKTILVDSNKYDNGTAAKIALGIWPARQSTIGRTEFYLASVLAEVTLLNSRI